MKDLYFSESNYSTKGSFASTTSYTAIKDNKAVYQFTGKNIGEFYPVFDADLKILDFEEFEKDNSIVLPPVSGHNCSILHVGSSAICIPTTKIDITIPDANLGLSFDKDSFTNYDNLKVAVALNFPETHRAFESENSYYILNSDLYKMIAFSNLLQKTADKPYAKLTQIDSQIIKLNNATINLICSKDSLKDEFRQRLQ